MYSCVRENIMLGRHEPETYVTPTEFWDCSQGRGEIIEERKLGNEIEDRQRSWLITYRTISDADLLFTGLINAVVTVLYCICNAWILTVESVCIRCTITHVCVCCYVCISVGRVRTSCWSYHVCDCVCVWGLCLCWCNYIHACTCVWLQNPSKHCSFLS